MPCIGQRVAAAVAQHVAMHLEGHSSALTYALDKAIDGVGRERAAALGREHKAASREIAGVAPGAP